MTKEEAIKKFSASIYTNRGEISLKILRRVAIAAGLNYPMVHRDCCDDIFINYECIDPYGEAVGEVGSAYDFCRWLAERDQKAIRKEKLRHLNQISNENKKSYENINERK